MLKYGKIKIMDKIIKKSFQIFLKNSSIMQPTIFYYLIMIVFAGIMKNRIFGNYYQLMILSFLSFLLFAAFLAGWLYMVQFAVSAYQPFDKNDKDYDLKIATYNFETLKKFFVGVGNYFIPVMAVILSLFIIQGAIYISGARLFNIDLQSMVNMPNNLLQNYVTNNTKVFLFT